MTHRFVETSGHRMHVAERGTGQVALLLHGFLESRCSRRCRLRTLGEAGYRAVAPAQRGYGRTERPAEANAAILELPKKV